jgi:hypothetical protein
LAITFDDDLPFWLLLALKKGGGIFFAPTSHRRISLFKWKKASGYHRRSLTETAMFRFKCLFGGNLKNRHFDRQVTEAYCRAVAMNKMTFLGMPNSVLQGDSA